MKPHSLPLHSATPFGMLIFLQTQFLQPSLEHAFAVAEWKEKRDQEQLDGPLGGNLRIWAIFIVMIKTLDFGQRSKIVQLISVSVWAEGRTDMYSNVCVVHV